MSSGKWTLVVSDINHDCLLYISNEGDIVSTLSLPSLATDICRWDSNQIGVTLPLQKQLRVIGNLSKTVRSVSLRQPYVWVCKLGKGQIVCNCDKPSRLDILAIKNYNQAEIIHRINIPFVVKSLSIENETLKLLIVTRGKAFQYNTRIDGGGHGTGDHHPCSIKMVPSVLMSQVKRPLNLYGGSIDQMFVYLIENSRMFAINDHNLLVNDLVTNNQLNYYIDLVDVFSRNISVSEMLSSSLYLQDLTVSDKARRVVVPPDLADNQSVSICCSVITENNLIAGYDINNKNIKILTFDGQFLDSVKLNGNDVKMCRWQSNTLVITTDDDKHELLTLKVEFPLLLVNYQTRNKYQCVACLSDNLLVCSTCSDKLSLYITSIDEMHSAVNVLQQINIPEALTQETNVNYIYYICDIIVTANDVIIVNNKRFIIFFNSDGQYLHSVRHYMQHTSYYNRMTSDDSFLYINSQWERSSGLYNQYDKIVCFNQTGEYNRIFLKRIYKYETDISNMNCKGPTFIGSHWSSNCNKLYVEGLFRFNRERFSVSRLQTDEFPVQVKDFDISDEGKTVVCEKANNGNVKIFDEDGELLCCRNVGSLVGGVCFTQEGDIMVTVPKRQEVFQLKKQDLKKYKTWESQVPYLVIWRKVGNIYWCVHINLIDCDGIKIDGDQVNILESVSLLNLDSDFHFPSMTSQMNKEIFTSELINKVKYTGGDEGGVRRGKSGEIIGHGRLKVRCGNFMAVSMRGIDEISVRRLPHRTAMIPLSIPTCVEPVNYDDNRDYNSKLIKLDDDVYVLLFRDTVTLISTTTGDILQHKQLPQQPLGICRWTDQCFIVIFGKEMVVFNRDLCHLKTINTEKYYNRIYKYNVNQLVCGGHYVKGRNEGGKYNYCYYVDIVDIDGRRCKYSREVCSGEVKVEEEVVVMFDLAVTSDGNIIIGKWESEELEQRNNDGHYEIFWYKEHLVRSIKVPRYANYYIHKPYLTTHHECIYTTDADNNIYEIPGHIEYQTSKDLEKYLLLRGEDNEVYKVLGFDISDNSFMVFGIIPGRHSFAFFHYDK
uniref:Uncharacterized protein n=1 Tax=Octopus bimaculoides TaxID=37653 RepID=A0A0L8H207_OCTBM